MSNKMDVISLIINGDLKDTKMNPVIVDSIDTYKAIKEIYLRTEKAMGRKKAIAHNYSASTINNNTLLNGAKSTY